MPPRSLPAACAPDTPVSTAPALWLVRHGESTWNIAGLAQGHNNKAELTDRGLRQAAEAAARFRGHPVRAIYTSDLHRALQTAAAFADVLGLSVRTDARLRERSLGVLEGTAHKAIDPAVTGLAGGLVIDPDAKPPAGESVRDLYLRAAAFADDLAPAHADDAEPASTGGDVLVIAHGGTVRVLDAYLHGVPVDQMSWRPVDNATIVRIPEIRQQLPGGVR